MTSAFPVQNRFQMAPLLNLHDLKSKTAPLPNISVFDSYGSYCYNLCSLSCISCMLKFVYVLMGHMAYCMNKLLTYLLLHVFRTFLMQENDVTPSNVMEV